MGTATSDFKGNESDAFISFAKSLENMNFVVSLLLSISLSKHINI